MGAREDLIHALNPITLNPRTPLWPYAPGITQGSPVLRRVHAQRNVLGFRVSGLSFRGQEPVLQALGLRLRCMAYGCMKHCQCLLAKGRAHAPCLQELSPTQRTLPVDLAQNHLSHSLNC